MSEFPPPTFSTFGLDPRLVDQVAILGYDTPTPIQQQAMPVLLAGRDLVGQARTGSGKTAAFALPLLHRLAAGGNKPRALVLTPTRELALQVTDAIRELGTALPVRVVTLYGGVPYGAQLKALERGVPVVVGTPGRLLDHLDRGRLDLSEIEVVVVDEADEMLRMGFIDDVERLLAATPPTRQVALFSATMPPPIRAIAAKHLKDAVEVRVETRALSAGHIAQRWLLVPEHEKPDALARVLASEPPGATLVFARTKAGCGVAAEALAKRGLRVDALHGDLAQAAREMVLGRLRGERLDVVVATDVAARGIDVEHLTLVINLDLPNDPESYVHRIGRTGRAGREGKAISLVTPREVPRIRSFERSLGVNIERMEAPTDAEIVASQRARFIVDLDRAPTAAHLVLADEVLATARSPREALGAVLELLAIERGLKLEGEEPDTRPPPWARAQKPGKVRTGPEEDEVEVFLPMGKNKGLRPADVVGALANELGIPLEQIGRITIVANACFLRVPREVGEHLLADVGRIELRGASVPFVKARPSKVPAGPAPRPFRRTFGAGSGKKPARR